MTKRISRTRTKKTIALASAVSLVLTLSPGIAMAAPGGPSGGGAPGGSSSSSSVTWAGATEITSAATQTGQTYASTSADENALLVNTSDDVTIADPAVTKSGGTSASDTYSFYGINSGVMCKGGGTTTITGGTVTTDAAGANGVFSYGANSGTTNATGDGTTVNITGTTITTTGNGSGGIMTTYGGTTKASNLTVTTSGGSSAPIRTDRGGGWVTVTGGTYTSSGQGSPAIYSTADVQVSDATLVSNKSEGTCIEGTGSIALTDCDLTASNSALNGNAQFYDTIMIYQSQSGDASSGASSFSMTGGSLTSNNGDVFHVTNTTATIALDGVDIVNKDSDGVLISVCDDGWSGASNVATLTATDQELSGILQVGSDSTLTLSLAGASTFTGTTSGSIANDKGSSISTSLGTVNVTMADSATWKLSADTTISSLSGTSGTIDFNGHTLTVGSTSYTSGTVAKIASATGSSTDASSTDSSSGVTSAASGTSTASSSDGTSAASSTSTDTSASGASETSAVSKAEQPMTAKGSKKTVRVKKLKKKAVKLKKCVTVKNAKGSLSYKNASKAAKPKKFKVNAKTGAITLPKGTKKGSYKVRVRVTAAGTANYKSGSKTVTVKVTVK